MFQFNLSFVATDDKGASATWSPKINMCACDHGGQCVPPEEGDEVNTDSKFVYMGCACQGGYTGRFCDSDIDTCEMNGQPCYAGVNCTDLPAPANVSGYTCGSCPTGFTGNGAQCAGRCIQGKVACLAEFWNYFGLGVLCWHFVKTKTQILTDNVCLI